MPLRIALAIRMTAGPRAAECRADLARDGFRTNDANVLDPLAPRIASDGQIRVTFITTARTVLGESDEDQPRWRTTRPSPRLCPPREAAGR